MFMINWAEREVQIACKREAPDRKDGEWDYGCDCYESALKAYKSLCEDGHSGLSFSLTKQILIRLMNHNPLTPIEDVPDVWNETHVSYDGSIAYQCNREFNLIQACLSRWNS